MTHPLVHRLALALVAAGAVGLTVTLGPRPVAARADNVPAPPRPFAWQGTGSCASGACHNAGSSHGTADAPTRLSEYTTWVSKDPHARAYAVLFSERSQTVERNYRQLGAGVAAHAERDVYCLKCHVDPSVEKVPEEAPVSFSDGVGCESCHGAAERWLAPHAQPGWKGLPRSVKTAYGMTDTKDLRVRAETCVECHVGSARCEVNHDLIAAGHPRLNFEYSWYLALYQQYQHWDLAADLAREPDYEARAWELGQAVSATAALKLLAVRAHGAEVGSKPWPEFAESDCYACHQQLSGQPGNWGRGAGKPGLAVGNPHWNAWYVGLAKDHPAGQSDPELQRGIDELAKRMSNRLPDPKAVAADADALAARFAAWLPKEGSRRSLDADGLRRRLATLSDASETAVRGYTWDEAKQTALAMQAHYRALWYLDPAGRDPKLGTAIWDWSKLMRFPVGQDSPPPHDPTRLSSEYQHIHDLTNAR